MVYVEVTSHSYWKHGAEVQSMSGRVHSQLSSENGGNLYGENKQFFTFSLGMKKKGRVGKKKTRVRPGRLGKFWSM
jgi:hypothetical protein